MLSILYRYLRKTIRLQWHNYKNRRYWTKYYKAHRENLQPSTFAQYCHKNYLVNSPHKLLLELGCGNGRYSIYFIKNNLNVTGLDIAGEEIRYLKRKNLSSNLNFVCSDFTVYNKPNHFDYIYSRFTFHAITEDQENSTLQNSFINLKHGGIIFIEARSIKDEMFKASKKISSNEGETDHYRRFIVFDDFINKIKQSGFEIIESVEQSGLAAYKDDDPVVIRVIAKKP